MEASTFWHELRVDFYIEDGTGEYEWDDSLSIPREKLRLGMALFDGLDRKGGWTAPKPSLWPESPQSSHQQAPAPPERREVQGKQVQDQKPGSRPLRRSRTAYGQPAQQAVLCPLCNYKARQFSCFLPPFWDYRQKFRLFLCIVHIVQPGIIAYFQYNIKK